MNRELTTLAHTGFKVLGMRHFGRLDFLVDRHNVPWFLEANAIPGMTDHSLLPKAARQIGIPISGLCARLVQAAADQCESDVVNRF